MVFVALYPVICARNCKPDSKSQPEFSNPFSLSTASQKPVLRAMILTTVCVTDGSETGGIYNEARLTTDLTIYRFLSAAEKTLFFFLPTKPARNPLKKRPDHSFYHRQTRSTRKQWTKNARGASSLERKRYESTQSAREDRPMSVGVVEAAHSSRVTQTK